MSNTEQFPADEDGCVYFYDSKKEKFRKICDVSAADLPQSVKERIRAAKDRADEIAKIPAV
jgi:hypothetical protein